MPVATTQSPSSPLRAHRRLARIVGSQKYDVAEDLLVHGVREKGVSVFSAILHLHSKTLVGSSSLEQIELKMST